MRTASSESANLPADTRPNASRNWIVLITVAGWFAMAQCFTTMPIYDDESYVMMTMQTFFDGHPLYQETYTQYGPAFYLVQTPIHDWFNVPITHDVIRVKTVVVWLLLIAGFGYVATLVTNSRWAGILAGMFVTLHIDKLALEPGHPQELIAIAGVAALIAISRPKSKWLVAAGLFAAVVGMTKINAGVTVALPLLFAASWGCQNSRLTRSIFRLLSFCCVALPAALVGAFVTEGVTSGNSSDLALKMAAAIWPAILTFAALLTWIVADKQSSSNSNSAPFGTSNSQFSIWLVVGGGLLGAAGVAAWAMTKGNSASDLVWGMLLQHSFITKWFVLHVCPTPLEFLAAIGAGFVGINCICSKPPLRLTKVAGFSIAVLLCVSLIFIAMDGFYPMQHGLWNRGATHMLATIGPLLMPLVVLTRPSRLRVALAMTGVLGPMLAYPTPGTQLTLGTTAVLVGLVILFFDVVQSQIIPEVTRLISIRRLIQVLSLVVVMVSITSSVRWLRYEPLAQPGCHFVRLEPNRSASEKAVAKAIRSTDAETLAFDLQNHNRFYFWTKKRPLTAISPTFWPVMLTDWQAQKIDDALDRESRVCVVKVGKKILPEFCGDLRRKIVSDFELIEQIDKWQVGVRTNSANRPDSLMP